MRQPGTAIFLGLVWAWLLSPAPLLAQTGNYDGIWSGHYKCRNGDFLFVGDFAIRNGEYSVSRNWPDGSAQLKGKVATDGAAQLAGSVVKGSVSQAVQFAGKFERSEFAAKGSVKAEDARAVTECDLTVRMVRPAPESLEAKYIQEQPLKAALENPPRLSRLPDPPAISCSISAADRASRQSSRTKGPKLVGLVVGISRYQFPPLNLALASKDACDIAKAWVRQQGALYSSVEIKVLLDEAAHASAIREGLDWLARSTEPQDVATLFVAGHGLNSDDGAFLFLPHNTDAEDLSKSGIRSADLMSALSRIRGKVLVFLDTCHAGAANIRSSPPNLDIAIEDLRSAESGIVLFSAATGRQFVVEDASLGNGAFTKAIVEGISGKADYTRDGIVTVSELELYVADRVKQLTGGRQSPGSVRPASGSNFPISTTR